MVVDAPETKQENFHMCILYAYRAGVEFRLWQRDLYDRMSFSADMHERMYHILLAELFYMGAYKKDVGEFTHRAFFEAFDKGRSDSDKHRKLINLGE